MSTPYSCSLCPLNSHVPRPRWTAGQQLHSNRLTDITTILDRKRSCRTRVLSSKTSKASAGRYARAAGVHSAFRQMAVEDADINIALHANYVASHCLLCAYTSFSTGGESYFNAANFACLQESLTKRAFPLGGSGNPDPRRA